MFIQIRLKLEKEEKKSALLLKDSKIIDGKNME